MSAEDPDERIRQAGEFYFSTVAGPAEIQKLHYLIFGQHGSEWSGLLDMTSAHVHTSLASRYRVAEIIQVSYDLSAANHLIRQPPRIEADRPLLLKAIAAAKEASLSGQNASGYTIWQLYEPGFCSAMMARARIDSGATQKELAKALGKTEHTIHNWESGHSPSFLDLCAWFRVLNMPAWRYIHCTLYPSENLPVVENDETRRDELIRYLSGTSSQELRKTFYLVAGTHGSNWLAILEMMFEHVCSPLAQRVISARSVLIGYQMEHYSQQAAGEVHVMPDLENLERCIRLGTYAAKNGKAAYKT
ncbi:helix-turn-helix transcriptional regulator [Dysosmobacter sp.]|uniref:helix-turn-helix transcriptional regulator n=1 Tax=Dysosmobacter sp. TaxID=2591382 RepID=UPI002A849B4E|nr:helix-turn-helix transcriptional regulator [Dysosmobacter sp.]MDY3282405.1 helix-turn-helix transcriptional regulator [Dysosmobacter sp.]